MRRRDWLGGFFAAGAGWALPHGVAQAQSNERFDHETLPWPAGLAAPGLQLPDLAGRTWSLDDFRGRVVVLNFWATWCPPCRAEMPSMQQMAEFYGPDALQVLAVDVGETAQRVGRYLADARLKLVTLLDGQKTAARAWGVRALPTTVIIDAQGQPRHVLHGELDWLAPEASALLEPLMPLLPRDRATSDGSRA